MKQLILGGARSGKSRLAEQYAKKSGYPVSFIATATADDDEMSERISNHRQRRPDDWKLIEEPVRLANVIQQHDRPDHCFLVDCLTVWVANLLVHHAGASEQRFIAQRTALLKALPGLQSHIIFVSNELGMGIVPMDLLSRRYRDEIGRLHQELAGMCDRVTLCVAGLTTVLKEPVV